MPDYNWFSDENIQVAADGIRAEAKKWYDLSDRMTTVSNAAKDQTLTVGAFVVTDISGVVTAADLSSAYNQMHTWLNGLFSQAVDEFDKFGKALMQIADWYEESDENSAQNFDEIASS
ncbi:type VII secretion target [Couchioplanes caeruleus]|uniref:Excreted virulence factor EspC (Type VII ESX diderm) n=2 Tax=Couchioplanes caeruleus TaxID=56438 RepID=A0A1K0GM86_9ACTN|nr:type VII secretion target [Couchioplanes caeruleus]OJF10315.1 hypothetical protein BG844_32585 [Couchioplanes caeruleus subsp. caeruleus]ROP30036.1 excreted virulence factor EspC (type VII ESX diderm) [Couchioplanes caeruleus]